MHSDHVGGGVAELRRVFQSSCYSSSANKSKWRFLSQRCVLTLKR